MNIQTIGMWIGKETTLDRLRSGAIFVVVATGRLAVKADYHYYNAGLQYECVLLETGEHGHFPDKNQTIVREIYIKVNDPAQPESDHP